jgi:hypothetical protein
MAADPVSLLKTVAKRFGKSVHEANLFDANVCTSPTDPDRPWEHLPLPGDIFRHKVDIAYAAHRVRLRANGEFVVAEIPSNLNVEVLSINRQDKVFQLEPSPFKVPSFPALQIFASSRGGALRQFLASPSLTLALTALRLKEAESLHIYRNGPVLYFKPESPDEVLSAVETLRDLVQKLPSFDGGVNLDGLPPEFKKLSPLIRKWAELDDELRSELLERKSESVLRKFVTAVEPHIPSINEYLDSFREEAPPEAAAALGRLAECASEARLILEKPKTS